MECIVKICFDFSSLCAAQLSFISIMPSKSFSFHCFFRLSTFPSTDYFMTSTCIVYVKYALNIVETAEASVTFNDFRYIRLARTYYCFCLLSYVLRV